VSLLVLYRGLRLRGLRRACRGFKVVFICGFGGVGCRRRVGMWLRVLTYQPRQHGYSMRTIKQDGGTHLCMRRTGRDQNSLQIRKRDAPAAARGGGGARVSALFSLYLFFPVIGRVCRVTECTVSCIGGRRVVFRR
jgi:hypothetical protein